MRQVMRYELTFPGSTYIGADLGNPKLDYLGAQVDADTFPTQVIDSLVTNEERGKLSLDRRRQASSRRDRVIRAGATIGTVLALAGGVVEISKARHEPHPTTPNKVELVNQRGVAGSSETILGRDATPAQVYEQQVIENSGRLPEAP